MSARRAVAGMSLIEVMVAVALLAMVMLAVTGSQLAMLRAQRATIWRERALWLADARIESTRVSPDADPGLAALAAASLPKAALTIGDGPGGMRFVAIGWRDGDTAAPSRGDAAGGSASSPQCVRISFIEARIDDR